MTRSNKWKSEREGGIWERFPAIKKNNVAIKRWMKVSQVKEDLIKCVQGYTKHVYNVNHETIFTPEERSISSIFPSQQTADWNHSHKVSAPAPASSLLM